MVGRHDKQLATPSQPYRKKRRSRGRHRGQTGKRKRERRVHKRAIVYKRVAKRQGKNTDEIASALGISAETLLRWEREWISMDREITLRGRPAKELAQLDRDAVLSYLDVTGPRTGLPTLLDQFSDLPVRALEDLLIVYKQAWRRRRRTWLPTLSWTRVNSVWAMDHTEPDNKVDRQYGTILVVKDLASGMTLAAMPMPGETAESTAVLLRSLFAAWGAPLILKSDNGGALTGTPVQQVLRAWQVTPLISPPYYPQFNGACEAGVGAVKTRAHHIAARHGREACWSCDDVEGARLACNELVRPGAPSPETKWQARESVSGEERERFRKELARARKELDSAAETDHNDLMAREEAQRERESITRALGRLGYFTVRRRRIPLPLKP